MPVKKKTTKKKVGFAAMSKADRVKIAKKGARASAKARKVTKANPKKKVVKKKATTKRKKR